MTPYVKIMKDKVLYEGFLEQIPREGETVYVKNINGKVWWIVWRMPQFIGGAVDHENRFEIDIHIK